MNGYPSSDGPRGRYLGRGHHRGHCRYSRKIQRFLSQPFHVAEVFTGFPGKLVPVADTVRSFKAICSGEYGHLPRARLCDVASSMVTAIVPSLQQTADRLRHSRQERSGNGRFCRLPCAAAGLSVLARLRLARTMRPCPGRSLVRLIVVHHRVSARMTSQIGRHCQSQSPADGASLPQKWRLPRLSRLLAPPSAHLSQPDRDLL
jgi:hypothetical protein